MYESRPRTVIVTLGNKLYRIPQVAPPTAISLFMAKQCSKLISKTEKFVFLRIHPQGKKNTDHRPLQFIRMQGKFQNDHHQKWSTYLQQFRLNIKYKKGSTNNVADCLRQPLIMALTTVLDYCGHKTSDQLLLYKSNPEFGHTYHILFEGQQVLGFHFQDALLCHMGYLCVPSSERVKMIWEAYYKRTSGHFGVEKTMAILQKYFYWSNL